MIVNYSISFKALLAYVKAHNAAYDDKKKHVRSSMLHTAQQLIRIYGVSLTKANRICPITSENIPSLRTNNPQLAQLTQQSGRTIRRHIKRLMEAGIITEKIGHGSNASYEVFINPEILWIKGVTTPKEENKAVQAYKKIQTENQLDKNNIGTKCPHTDSSNTTGNINNILIPVDKLQQQWQGDPFKRSVTTGYTARDTRKRSSPSLTGFYTGNTTGNTISGDTQENDLEKNDARENERRRGQSSDPQVATDKDGTHDPTRHALLVSYAAALWKLARKELYKNTHLTPGQCTIGEQLLYIWYASVKTKYLEIADLEYRDRIVMVKKYLDKHPEKRYVQLPYLYFDPNNKSGFTGTKSWYRQHKKNKEELRLQLILQQQLRKYRRNAAKDTATRKPLYEVYRECEQRIGKLNNEEISQQFYKTIAAMPADQYTS